MQNLEELKQKHAELGEAIKKLEEAGKDPRKRAKEGVHYYYVDNQGYAATTKDYYATRDNARFNSGNYFLTKEAAEKHAKRRKVFDLMWAYAECFEIAEIDGFMLLIDVDNQEIKSEPFTDIYNQPKFEASSDARRVINLIGEDVIKEAWE